MQPTVYQKPEIRDSNDDIIQQGAFGKNTPLCNSNNTGWIDYVMNDLEALQGGVAGAADSASTATQKAQEAAVKANEALQAKTDAVTAKNEAITAKNLAIAAQEAAELAASQAAEITTPDGLAARVLALEDRNVNLGFSVVDGKICQTYLKSTEEV